MKSLIILLAVLTTSSTYAQIWNPCDSQTTCHDCIQRPSCAWCIDPNYNHNRCFQPALNTVDKCREEYIWNPENEVRVLEHEVISKAHQVAPQRINMKLRINEAYTITVSYTHAQDFPVDQISTNVEFKDNSTEEMRVNYYSNCFDLNDKPKPTNVCSGMKLGDVVQFKVDIKLTSCPKNPKDWKKTLQIYPVGIIDSLTVDLEMMCSCPCESPDHFGYKSNAEECSGKGVLKCGVCECDSNNFGKHCECSVDQTANCKADNTSTVDCSGRGTCICGQCECDMLSDQDEVIHGEFCECDNFSCNRHNDLLCSGADHGACVCGQCQCLPSWSGPSCSCSSSNDTCYSPGDTKICSGHGSCVCGKCQCETTENERYVDKYCNKSRCAEFKDCVQCQIYKTGPLSEEQCVSNCTFDNIVLREIEANEENNEHICSYQDEDNCEFKFVYTHDENNKILIKAQEERKCYSVFDWVLRTALGSLGER